MFFLNAPFPDHSSLLPFNMKMQGAECIFLSNKSFLRRLMDAVKNIPVNDFAIHYYNSSLGKVGHTVY